MAGDLPAAVSVTDELLTSLIGEVRGLRSDLQRAASPAAAPSAMPPESGDGEERELTEPKLARARAKKRT